MTKIEILAPAGNMHSLIAAVRCGADAVYLGGKNLNARRSAENFDPNDLMEAVRYCHQRDVKVYMTLNTVVLEEERALVLQALQDGCDAGVDAIIVQDLAVAALARQAAPGLALHASTQMAVHNLQGAQQLEQLGFERMVLPRELSGSEIAQISAGTSLALECFVHGALCMCVSGQCYLSSVIGGRSGNRGMCAQPCRLPFVSMGKEYSLSLKDLSLVDRIQQLGELGVTSLKIEGRMKRPEYVAAAVTACRQALAGEQPDFEALEAVFSRSGFTSGYFDGQLGRQMFGVRSKQNVQAAPAVLGDLAALYREERPSIPLEMRLSVQPDTPATLVVRDGAGHQVTAVGAVAQQARTAPTTPEKAQAALEKTGGTPFYLDSLTWEIGPGLMLPASALNALRRDALEQLTQLRSQTAPHPFAGDSALLDLPRHTAHTNPPIWGIVSRAEQVSASLLAQLDRLAIPVQMIGGLDAHLVAEHCERMVAYIPAILFGGIDSVERMLRQAKEMGITAAMAGNLGGIQLAQQLGFEVIGDVGLNITNSLALEQYRQMGLESCVLSVELKLSQIRGMGGEMPRGLLAYGHLPLMVTRNCPVDDCASCKKSFPQLVDRKGNQFFVDCTFGVSTLYNCVPLYLAERLGEFSNVDFFVMLFTRESPQQCVALAEDYRAGRPLEGEKTRGLYYRGIL